MQELQSISANFPRNDRKLAQCTRNKIAQVARPALRVLPQDFASCMPDQEPDRVSKNLDEIDLKILSEIQADGRITNVELAKRVGISPPPCLRRVRTLEEEGYIQGYRGLLDPRRLGFDVRCLPRCICRARPTPICARSRSSCAPSLGAGMLDAVGRDRFHPEMRRARHGDVPGFRHPSHGRPACAQRPDIAGAAQFEIRSRGAA